MVELELDPVWDASKIFLQAPASSIPTDVFLLLVWCVCVCILWACIHIGVDILTLFFEMVSLTKCGGLIESGPETHGLEYLVPG